MAESVLEQITKLRDILRYHARKYYVEDAPEISDFEYDKLFYQLVALEKEHPEYYDPNSPTVRVGGKAEDRFKKIEHNVPLKSLVDVFSYEELKRWIDKLEDEFGTLRYSVECKIDGLSVALHYENGALVYGATRGDGTVGEDVTMNVRTIRSLPLVIDYQGMVEVRGEVYMPKDAFEALNAEREKAEESLFANPRNAAAGSLRQLDSKIVATRGLDLFIFNLQASDKEFESHGETFAFMKEQGFPTVPYQKVVCGYEAIVDAIEEIGRMRLTLPFDIDGVVIKVDSLDMRRKIGEATSTPKWAVAYKFPPEQKETILKDIVIQVGRTGVLTPIAELEPVRIAGSVVSRATLHNIDFIRERDVRIGDTVVIQKAGDIIPEIVCAKKEKREKELSEYAMPEFCPSCHERVYRDEEAAVRCNNATCPAQLMQHLVHFASKDAMDIAGLGPQLLKLLKDNGLVKTVADLYRLQVEELVKLDRMGQKSAENLVNAIAASKERGLARLIYALGIRLIGEATSEALAMRYNSIDELSCATIDDLVKIDDFGMITAESVVRYFSLPSSVALIEELKSLGVKTTTNASVKVDDRFAGMTFVLTGTLPTMGRSEAEALIKRYGGKTSSSVSKKTSVVLCGEDAGSKLTKARDLGVRVIDEAEFLAMIE